MNNQSWTVHAEGVPREVTVDFDPQSGRTFIRMDGRMAAKPMSAEEDEREVMVGNDRYVLRKLPGNTYDLDLAPPDVTTSRDGIRTTSRQWTAPGTTKVPQKEKSDVPIGRWIFKTVVVILILAAVGWFRNALAYMRVPWESYTGPNAKYRLKFAGPPEQDGNKLRTRYRDHWYVLEWVDLGGPLHPSVADTALTKYLGAIVKDEKAELIESKSITYQGKFARSFIMQMPESERWSEGTARGNIILTNYRVYIIYAYVPRGESLSFDVGEFLRSLELPEEPEPNWR